MNVSGLLGYFATFAIAAGAYSIASLGLNVQFGYTGLYNFGIAAFFATGAYVEGIITGGPSMEHLGGFDLPVLVGVIAAMVVSAILAYIIGIPTLRLKGEFLGISSLGIAETIRLIITNEKWLAGGVWGLGDIPRPLGNLVGPKTYNWVYLGLVLAVVGIIYFLVQKIVKSPWGRVLKAIREDEGVAAAMGKNVYKYKMQSLILGSVIMAVGGAFYAHYVGYLSPESFRPLMGTFIIWAMLMAGGKGNNKGAILGAFVVWGVWTFTEFFVNYLPSGLASRAGYINAIFIAILFQVLIRIRPQGILGGE
ncbi:MAG: branched-chain amino acid ABC transporter permease [Candidatus Bipolaricaulota bacterium]|nr:branched-chain amino acid ABC transporter permease [Candidatus Bipolaricaulota bacterium]MBS3791314.1 branched-chain amino acid ABC transporter permease [Candidatus Bipolaricaulota bacterium]